MNNYSKQREIILNALYYLRHPTAEQLYNQVHKNNPTISKSTVYKNLNILLKNKVIRKIKLLNGEDRFDYIGEEHYHIICESCGKVFDFIYPFEKEELKEVIKNQTGVMTRANSITVYGICGDYKSKKEEK